MLSFLTKKKISDDTLSNIMVNGIFKLVEEGFGEVKELLLNDAEFERKPDEHVFDQDMFLMIVIAGNISFLPNHFSAVEQIKFQDSISQKICRSLELSREEFKQETLRLHQLFYRLNHPSKNTKYAMSKAVFEEFDLYQYQSEYFGKMRVANPVTLKKLNDLMDYFIWDWDMMTKRYKIVFE